MSEQIRGSDATLREFINGQNLFGRYTLVKILCRGGMGIVWLARDEELEGDVALKFFPEMVIRDRAVLTDLKRETKRCLELTHPTSFGFTILCRTNARAASRWKKVCQ